MNIEEDNGKDKNKNLPFKTYFVHLIYPRMSVRDKLNIYGSFAFKKLSCQYTYSLPLVKYIIAMYFRIFQRFLPWTKLAL